MADSPQSVEQLFGDVLDLPPDQRSAYLDHACRHSPGLRLLVEELLKEDALAAGFMDRPVFERSSNGPAATGAVPGSAFGRTSSFAPPPSRFKPLDVIADRFLVVRFIDRGGMGEVYEVEDRLLHNAHVALKIIRPEIAADEASTYRFEQEVLLARKVVHSNLCPIYEIFHCKEPAPPFLFLTMKLLQGETLGACLKRPACITSSERVHICTELIAGVSAIHAASVIHRDLKPNNVMLERSAAGTLCVSIMDFGLARLHESEFTHLGTGLIAGTPGYLAPELLNGQRPSQATDLFALGVVLHQVLTGERPADARHGASLAPKPSLDKADAPPRLIAAVKALLSDDPEMRCRAFDQVRGNTAASGISGLAFPRAPLMTRRRFAMSATASVFALAGLADWKRDQVYNLLHPLPSKRFVALLTWPPPSDGRVRPMLTGLIDAMADELARAEAFDHNFFVAAQKNVSDMRTPAQLNDVRESLGANLVLATSGNRAGNDVHVSMHLLDPDSGRTLRSREIRASIDQVLSLPQRAVHAAAELLGINRYESDDRRTQVGTDNPDALAAFQAAEWHRKEENDTGLDQAIQEYNQALELDPRYAMAQARLGAAYVRSYALHGDSAALVLARENCETAIRQDPNLVDAHIALAYALEVTGDRQAALREVAKALAIDPSNARTLIYQANINADEGHYTLAEDTFKRALKLRPNYWYPHTEYGVLLDNQGRYPEALMEFRTASLAAPKNALLFSNIGSVYLQLGDIDQAIQNSKASFDLQPNDGAAVNLASAYRISKRFPDALAYAQKAVNLNPAQCVNWIELGDSIAASNRPPSEVLAAFRRAVTVQEDQLHTEPKNGPGWMFLALCRAKLGEPATVNTLISRAETLHADDITSELFKVRTLELLGKRDDAVTEISHCLARGATVFQFQTMPDLQSLRSDPRYQKMVSSVPSPGEKTV